MSKVFALCHARALGMVLCLLSDEGAAEKTRRNARNAGVDLVIEPVDLDPESFKVGGGLLAVVRPISKLGELAADKLGEPSLSSVPRFTPEELSRFAEDLRNVTDDKLPCWLVDGCKRAVAELISRQG